MENIISYFGTYTPAADGAIANFKFEYLCTLGFAAIVIFLGRAIVAHSAALRKYAIPAPVVSGIIFSLLISAIKMTGTVSISFDAKVMKDLCQNLFFLCGSQCFYRRKLLGKAFKIWNQRCNAGLLSHDLADPNLIGILGPSKRQIPFVFFKPSNQALRNSSIPILHVRITCAPWFSTSRTCTSQSANLAKTGLLLTTNSLALLRLHSAIIVGPAPDR